jgi:hypothetical protein
MKLASLALAVAIAAACSSQKDPAAAAIAAADAAWAAVKAETAKLVPDQAKSVDAAIAAAKDAFAKGDYAKALKDATGVTALVADAQKAATAKKEEWVAAWRTLDSTVGSALTAIGTQVDALATAKKLPAGVEKTAVEGAKATLASAQQMYADAKALYQSGDYDAALKKAGAIKDEVGKIMTSLKLEMPVGTEAAKTLGEAATKTLEGMMKK